MAAPFSCDGCGKNCVTCRSNDFVCCNKAWCDRGSSISSLNSRSINRERIDRGESEDNNEKAEQVISPVRKKEKRRINFRFPSINLRGIFKRRKRHAKKLPDSETNLPTGRSTLPASLRSDGEDPIEIEKSYDLGNVQKPVEKDKGRLMVVKSEPLQAITTLQAVAIEPALEQLKPEPKVDSTPLTGNSRLLQEYKMTKTPLPSQEAETNRNVVVSRPKGKPLIERIGDGAEPYRPLNISDLSDKQNDELNSEYELERKYQEYLVLCKTTATRPKTREEFRRRQ